MPKKKPGKKAETPSLKKLLRRRVAIHEAGHAVAAWFEPHLPKVTKVTIKPGKGYLGYARVKFKRAGWSLATEDVYRALVRFTLGGMMAERACLSNHSHGVFSDLMQATMIAYEMADLGMSTAFGPFAIGAIMPFSLSEVTKARADKQAETTLRDCEKQVVEGFEKRKSSILAVAKALLKKKTLYAKQLKNILGPRPKRIK